jgi:hypothetical protein
MPSKKKSLKKRPKRIISKNLSQKAKKERRFFA